MWEYLAAHPWWALVYLVIICVTVVFCSIAWAARPSQKREDRQGVPPSDLN